MKNLKYHYNYDSASYEPVQESKFSKIKFPLFVGLFGIALVGFVWMGVRAQDAENLAAGKSTKLSDELEMMQEQYSKLENKIQEADEVLEEVIHRDDMLYRAYFDIEPISDDVRSAGYGGADRYAKFKSYKNGESVANVTQQIDVLNNKLLVQSQSLDELKSIAETKTKELENIPAIQPLANKDLLRLSSGYGMRRHPILGIGKMHWGLDFKANPGKPIYATANGTVERSDRMGGYGNVVVLNHENGYKTLYAHMQRQNVAAGQKVLRGDVIGFVGNSGLSSGPHLHYEVIKGEDKVNPISYFYQDLSPEEFKKLYDMSEEMSISMD